MGCKPVRPSLEYIIAALVRDLFEVAGCIPRRWCNIRCVGWNDVAMNEEKRRREEMNNNNNIFVYMVLVSNGSMMV